MISSSRSFRLKLIAITAAALAALGCEQIRRPDPAPYIAEPSAPEHQEFRWSNGRAVKHIDPARAAAPPETDVIRSIYEGLTELDPRTLEARPAAAEKWTSAEDDRVWTFTIRKDARWTNGKRVTSGDFVSSWRRLLALGEKAANRQLISNFVGAAPHQPAAAPPVETFDVPHAIPDNVARIGAAQSLRGSPQPTKNGNTDSSGRAGESVEQRFGVDAVDDVTLKITLVEPDANLPKLVANTIFRPVYGGGRDIDGESVPRDVVTNGPFRIEEAGPAGISLVRDDRYWGHERVALARVRIIPADNAEGALEAYRRGEVDAVTNAVFEPLALKLLAPYDDFRRTTHNAVNLLDVNTLNPPFSDRRVREALAIAIDRDKLTEGELEGSTRPATQFLPREASRTDGLLFDPARARDLLARAGFPDGADFPRIRLVVNRNDTQQRIGRTLARMWKQYLNLETELIVKDITEMESVKAAGEYDLIRRGVVLPTVDELVGLRTIFGPRLETSPERSAPELKRFDKRIPGAGGPSPADTDTVVPTDDGRFTESDALYDLVSIPLYFPTSYGIVKPYVRGFELNMLDSPVLADVSIDNNWAPAKAK